MKYFSGLIFFFGVCAAHAEPPLLLEFSNGSQIMGSELNIYQDGSVKHFERTCCPPSTALIDEAPLAAEEVKIVSELLNDAATGLMITRQGSPTSMGSQSGFLKGYLGSLEIELLTVARNPNPGGNNLVTENQSTAAAGLRRVAEKYVKNPLVP